MLLTPGIKPSKYYIAARFSAFLSEALLFISGVCSIKMLWDSLEFIISCNKLFAIGGIVKLIHSLQLYSYCRVALDFESCSYSHNQLL